MIKLKYRRYLLPHLKIFLLILVLNFLSTSTNLINPFLAKLGIDKAYAKKDLKLFVILACISAGVFLLSLLTRTLSSYLSQRLNKRVQFNIAKDLFRHLQYLPLSFHNNSSSADNIFRMNSDVCIFATSLCSMPPQLIVSLSRLVFIFFMLFYLNFKLALVVLLLSPVSFIYPYFAGKKLRSLTKQEMSKTQNTFKVLLEVFSHIRLIKALGKENYETEKFEKNFAQTLDVELRNAKMSNIFQLSHSIFFKLLSGAVGLYGAWQIAKGENSLGGLTATMMYVTQIMGLLQQSGATYQGVLSFLLIQKRMDAIFEEKTTIVDSPDAVAHHIAGGAVEFKDITFGYKKDSFILRGLSFSVPGAAKIALVGPSGCGKTTVLSLLLRLYEPDEGAILIDGMDIRRIKLESLKAQISVALQEPFLWNDTIANNILYDAGTASAEEIIKSAKLAQAHEFIMGIEEKYEAVMGELACKISQGQKQRIAIARALLKKPKILILDEAFGSIDSLAEGKIIANIKEVLPETTMLVVSHRLSTVKEMDLVYFLENPSQVQIGTHEELIESNSNYKKLFASQIQFAPKKEVSFNLTV